ncbi:MAG: PaaI family thioesterase [Rhodobacteraceae bacterium]|nr:PaaI family thioesterase [Paracoccaceae bacterium]
MTVSPDRDSPAGHDRLLYSLTETIPYIKFLGIAFGREGDELTARLAFDPMLIGNPFGPALHGGVTAAFLEVAALIELSWRLRLTEDQQSTAQRVPKTISFSVDYLRPGNPEDAYARAVITRSGRRFASVHVEGWQQDRSRLFAQATGHFQLPAI